MNSTNESLKLTIFGILAVVITIFVTLYFSGYYNSTKSAQTDMSDTSLDSSLNKSSDKTNKTSNMKKTAQKGDQVVVHYTGKLSNGTKFDSSLDRGEPFPFILGAGQVIKGWDEGLVGVSIGEKKTLVIRPEDGYGSKANGPIPANSTLTFDIEIVDIVRAISLKDL